jgi:hypothetical protein
MFSHNGGRDKFINILSWRVTDDLKSAIYDKEHQ